MKQQHKSQKQDQKLRDIGRLILRFMNKKHLKSTIINRLQTE
jgi:hypothetical protein